MPKRSSMRAIARRHSSPLFASLASTLLFAVACNDSDAVRGTASAGAPNQSGVSGASGASGADAGSIAGAGGDAGAASGTAGSGASDAGDAGAAGAAGNNEAGAGGEPGEVPSCTAGGKLFVVGNYADADGNHLLLRSGAKAATFALVPAGVATPAKPPHLYVIDRVCVPGGALIAKDESLSYRVDFVQTDSQFLICISAPVGSVDAALALAPADLSHSADTGCSGKPFSTFTSEFR